MSCRVQRQYAFILDESLSRLTVQSEQAQLSPCSPVRGPMAATRPYPSDISILKVPKSSSKPFFDQAQLDGVADFAA